MNNKFSISLAAVLAFAALAFPSHQALAKSHTVVCKDGTSSASGRGACSGHGGVGKAAKHVKAAKPAKVVKHAKVAKTAKKAEPKKVSVMKSNAAKHAGTAGSTGATAKCKDGSYSHAKQHKGACSKHGGVAEWMGH